ncbi:MAG: hypothetical protein MJZ67_01465 [Bacteroidales bacterium]|nr:hypothetical protein [Bacteroidales bacterium]
MNKIRTKFFLGLVALVGLSALASCEKEKVVKDDVQDEEPVVVVDPMSYLDLSFQEKMDKIAKDSIWYISDEDSISIFRDDTLTVEQVDSLIALMSKLYSQNGKWTESEFRAQFTSVSEYVPDWYRMDFYSLIDALNEYQDEIMELGHSIDANAWPTTNTERGLIPTYTRSVTYHVTFYKGPVDTPIGYKGCNCYRKINGWLTVEGKLKPYSRIVKTSNRVLNRAVLTVLVYEDLYMNVDEYLWSFFGFRSESGDFYHDSSHSDFVWYLLSERRAMENS